MRQRILRKRSLLQHVNAISGVILIAAGAYIVWFWGTTLVSGASSLDSEAFRFVENLSQSALNFVSDHTGAVAVAMFAVVALATVAVIRTRTDDGDRHQEPKSTVHADAGV